MTMKKGRPGGGTPKRPTVHNPLPENSEPLFNCSTAPTTAQGPVSKFLRHGEANATSSHDLVGLVGCGTVRQLQGLIKSERDNGVLILSSTTGGYFLPSDGPTGRDEIQQFVDTLRARALNTLRTMQPARMALDILDGQLMYDDAGGLYHASVGSKPWHEYEADKAIVARKGYSPKEYENNVKDIAVKRGL